MTNAMSKSNIIKKYQEELPNELLDIYLSIVEERTRIYYTGYILGFLLSLILILYTTQVQHAKMSTSTMVCTTVAIAFLTNYFYYILTPKTNHMLDHVTTPEQTKAWLAMYKGMQYYYHTGLTIGLVAVGIFAFAFRCKNK
jgi:ABC-type Fe3+-siderophore transport system permease subunit